MKAPSALFFLSRIHDLKNRLSTLLLLAERLPDSGSAGGVKRRMDPYLRRMVAELESDLTVALVHQGAYAPSFLPTLLPALLERVAEGHQTYAEVKGIRLVVEAAAPGVWAEADARLLEEVVGSFVNNAIKFSPRGGRVRLHLQVTEEARAEIRVSDEGPGLSTADVAQAFQPLTRLSAEPTAGESSTGLGLSLAQEMIRLHGGRVWVDAPEGRGATFGLDLPLLAQRAAAG